MANNPPRSSPVGRRTQRTPAPTLSQELFGNMYEDEYDHVFELRAVKSVAEVNTDEWNQQCIVQEFPIAFKLDSGSQVDIIPKFMFDLMDEKIQRDIQPSKIKLKSYSNHIVRPKGQVTWKCKTVVGGKRK